MVSRLLERREGRKAWERCDGRALLEEQALGHCLHLQTHNIMITSGIQDFSESQKFRDEHKSIPNNTSRERRTHGR